MCRPVKYHRNINPFVLSGSVVIKLNESWKMENNFSFNLHNVELRRDLAHFVKGNLCLTETFSFIKMSLATPPPPGVNNIDWTLIQR